MTTHGDQAGAEPRSRAKWFRVSWSRAWSRQPERGSATVIGLGLIGVIASLLVAGLLIGAVALAGQQARTAADLAALAAAGRLAEGAPPGQACSTAAEVAERNQGRLVTCDLVDGGDPAGRVIPTVEVEVLTEALAGRWNAGARAAATGIVADR